MVRCGLKFGSLTVLASLASTICVSAQSSRSSGGFFRGGTITGTIVDKEGIPQMGALVQLLLPDTSLVATAVTDTRGRYQIKDLGPGSYSLRATAALFLPAVRSGLQLGTGSRAVVNLTLSTLLATSQWLPATRRSAENEDDWMWALRSSSMRPVLRVVDENGGSPLSISTSAGENHSLRTAGHLSVLSNTGGFARGGAHNVLVLERQSGTGATTMLRADFSGPRTPFPVAPSAELSVGAERQMIFGGLSRTVLNYTSHPELVDSQGHHGVQTAVLRNAQRMEIGDTLRLDAGSVVRAFNLEGNAVAMEPFLKLAYRPSDGVVIAYTLTQARGLESVEDLDRVKVPVPVAILRDGHVRLERGRHDALSLSVRSWKRGSVGISAYRDRFTSPALYGTGVLSVADRQRNATLADPTTETFAVTGRDYDATGVRLVVRQPVSNIFTVGAEVSDGRSLSNESPANALLGKLLSNMAVRNSVTSAIYVDGTILRTGTKLHSGYRWQPVRTLTAVDAFHNDRETAYLNCKLQQSLSRLPFVPGGMEAIVDLQNLLAQGYQPFLSSDGRTLYLTQSPRVIQAGLSFTF